ncbi:hypothetical protein O7632_16450 [Solwaraspora sp. WMMD406]|uniref:AMIN-like domain-containing (lipo)protein n=1 Tax=Solwaraspora sp. WMMD406 TaxID=3016095 RepID=UPI002417E3A3|nr:hypothetical protein [Solwaraspora sp. WMMD406]MDG4765676.1 hypothetical protein [Solwaraspora sp. WMMD406]
MTRLRVPLIVCLAALLVATGCTSSGGDGAGSQGSVPVVTATQPAGPGLQNGPDRGGPPDPTGGSGAGPAVTLADGRYVVRYGWAVPRHPAEVRHDVRPPVAHRPQPPLPYLAEIHAADHPVADPPYSRISFYFRAGFPSYEVSYVPRVVFAGSGDDVPLPGNCYLRIRFVSAQAHDEQGQVTVRRSPTPYLGWSTLRGYGFAGDFEGQVTYGLGIQVAGDGDQVLPIRVGELTRDGFHIVAIDVQRE